MTGSEILKADMLDILFENRNKHYGAYTLRKFYNQRLVLSLVVALLSVSGLFLFLSGDRQKKAIAAIEYKTVEIIDIVYPRNEVKPKPEPPKPQPAGTKQVLQQSFVDRIEIVDRDVTKAMPMQSGLVNISDHNIEGNNIRIAYLPAIPGPEKKHTTVQPPSSFEAAIQREPEFPGGSRAWIKFLQDHLQSPTPMEKGERKTVMIKFLVSADGSVTGFEVLQSGGRIYDKEVIRVLKLMPRWKPAIQNNEPVSRSFTQPVIFVGSEE